MIIDGIDIRTLGIFILRGGSNDFLSFPERREPDINDWAEHDGLEADLSECTFEAKRISVQLYISAPDESTFKQHLNAFETLHFAPGYRNVYVKEFDRTFLLRFVGFSNYRHKGGLGIGNKKSAELTVEYMMDDPAQLFISAVETPISMRPATSFVKLNGINFSNFGIVVQEIYSTALRPRSAKLMLERRNRFISGIQADVSATPSKKSREINIVSTMLAENLTEFYINYTALFNQLRKTTGLTLEAERTNKKINCYYSRMADFRKLSTFSNSVKVSFNLTFIELTDIDLYRLLADENEFFITTEDGYCIDLNY